MSRRPSIKAKADGEARIKERETRLDQRLKASENQISNSANKVVELREEIQVKETELASVSSRIKEQQETVALVRNEVEEASNEKRALEGEISSAKVDLKKIKESIDNAVALEIENVVKVTEELKDVIAKKNESEIESKTQAKTIKNDMRLLEQKRSILRKEVSEFNKKTNLLIAVEKDITIKSDEAEILTRQLLTTKVEIKQKQEELQEVTGLAGEKKRELEETQSKVIAEEKRVEDALVKLVNKEDDVQKKLSILRSVQQGLDRTEARIERKKNEDGLKDYLSRDQKNEVKIETN